MNRSSHNGMYGRPAAADLAIVFDSLRAELSGRKIKSIKQRWNERPVLHLMSNTVIQRNTFSGCRCVRMNGVFLMQWVFEICPMALKRNSQSRKWKTSLFYVAIVIHAHDDVIKWKHFPRHWPFVRGIHRSPNSPHKGQWRGTLMFSLIPRTKASGAELWCFLWSASE